MVAEVSEVSEEIGFERVPRVQAMSIARNLVNWAEIWLPGGFLLALAFCCFVLPELRSMPPSVDGSVLNANLPLGAPGHILGTDQLGNDVLSRLLAGGRVSLEVGFSTQLIGMSLGGGIGMIAGFSGGFLDATIMRLLDVLIAFPTLVLVLAIVDGLGASELHLIWALSAFSVPAFARLARAGTLRVRELPYVLAARLAGVKTRRVIVRHVVPGVFPQLVTFGLLGAGIAMLAEGALSYLGYGIPPPGASWGNMIAEGQNALSADPRLVFVPSIALLATVVALNMLGDALRSRWSAA